MSTTQAGKRQSMDTSKPRRSQETRQLIPREDMHTLIHCNQTKQDRRWKEKKEETNSKSKRGNSMNREKLYDGTNDKWRNNKKKDHNVT